MKQFTVICKETASNREYLETNTKMWDLESKLNTNKINLREKGSHYSMLEVVISLKWNYLKFSCHHVGINSVT